MRNADSENADDLRVPPRIFSQNLMEETGVVDVIVSVLHDLFPDDSETEGDDFQQIDISTPTNTQRSMACDRPPTENQSALEDGHIFRDSRVDLDTEPQVSHRSEPEMNERQETPPNQSDAPSTALSFDPMDQQQRQERILAMLFPLMDIVYELSSHQRCVEVLIVTGALHYVVFILSNITNPQDELLPLCLIICWNVLELCQDKMNTLTKCSSRRELVEQFRLRNATFFLSNEFTFQTLLRVLELLLTQGYRKQEKEMRNECLMILHLLARRRRSLDFFCSTGLTACLFSYATAAEMAKKNGPDTKMGVGELTANFHHFATNCDEDFEFKQMLWFLLAEITYDHEANLQELVQFRFLDTLLAYATGHDEQEQLQSKPPQSVQRYSPVQRQQLQTTAFSVLNHIVPSVLDHFYEIRGHTTLLSYIEECSGDQLLPATWLLMLQISQSVGAMQDELGDLHAVEAAVAAYATPPSRHTFGMRRNAILACASMCRGNKKNRQRFHDAHGVHSVVQHLVYDPSHSALEENILIGVIEAVRSCIVGHKDSEMAFIHEDGVPKLLSILERAPKALQHQVLAALAEICVNPAAVPSYLAWRSDHPETNNATAVEILLRIYAQEDAAENQRDHQQLQLLDQDSGIVAATSVRPSAFKSVANCSSPFIVAATPNTDQDIGNGSPVSTSNSNTLLTSPAFARLKEALHAAQGLPTDKIGTLKGSRVLELGERVCHPELNIKAKVYAVLANMSFACGSESLAPHYQVMLEVAREYPTFQLGEMWQNVHLALHAEGVRPIYADSLYIRKHLEHAFNIAVCTKHVQSDVFTRTQQRHSAEEIAFLEQILHQKHQEAQAEAFHRTNLRQNSTMKLHFDAKKTRLEFMRRQDPAAFAAYESTERLRIEDPAPEYEDEELDSLQSKEEELRGRLSTIRSTRRC